MAQSPQRVRIEEIDWAQALPFTRIFKCFWMAIWPPGKLALALALIVLSYIGGQLLSGIAGRQVLPYEIQNYAVMDTPQFERWVESEHENTARQLQRITRPFFTAENDEAQQSHEKALAESGRFSHARQTISRSAEAPDTEQREEARNRANEQINELERNRSGIFHAAFQFKLEAFHRLIANAFRLNFGFDGLLPGSRVQRDSVMGGFRDLFIVLPAWLMTQHPVFLTIYWLYALVIWSWLGGAISRKAALEATASPHQNDTASTESTFAFVRRRIVSYFTAPLLPLIFAAISGAVIAVIGLLFNVPLLNIVGGLLFGLLILLGFIVAMLLILMVAGSGMFYPAISVEGTDAFQAVSNAGNYLFGRFWHWLFYNIIALVYGAIVYLLLTFVLLFTLQITLYFAGSLVFVETESETPVNVFDAMVPAPQLNLLSEDQTYSDDLGVTDKTTAMLISGVWFNLCFALLGAFAISYYFCVQTWIYLLLRRSADGTGYDDAYREKV